MKITAIKLKENNIKIVKTGKRFIWKVKVNKRKHLIGQR